MDLFLSQSSNYSKLCRDVNIVREDKNEEFKLVIIIDFEVFQQ